LLVLVLVLLVVVVVLVLVVLPPRLVPPLSLCSAILPAHKRWVVAPFGTGSLWSQHIFVCHTGGCRQCERKPRLQLFDRRGKETTKLGST
jgi:hypothetical protein